MSNFDINLVNKLGRGGSRNPNSVGEKKEDLAYKKKLQAYKNKLRKLNRTNSNVPKSIKGSEFIGGVVALSQISNKSIDLYANYQTSKTGQTLHYSNIKATKNTIFSLGTNIVGGYINNELFGRNAVRRQNANLEYDRQLYNYNNQGGKYKAR